MNALVEYSRAYEQSRPDMIAAFLCGVRARTLWDVGVNEVELI